MKRLFNFGAAQRRCPRPMRPLARYRYVRLRWRVLFALVDLSGWLAVCLARLATSIGRGARRDVRRTPRSVLVVQLDHLGDAVLSTGLLRALRHAYPAARLDVLASDSNAELFRACPEANRVYVSRTNRLSRATRAGWLVTMLFWGWRLRRMRYDLGIDVRGEFPAAIILWLCGAPRRLGWGSAGGGFLLTDRPGFVWGRHEVRSRQALLDQLGISPPPNEAVWAPSFTVEPRWQRWAETQLPAGDANRPLVVLHCGAGTQAKQWSSQHWHELLARLVVERNARVLIVGGSSDVQRAEAILEHRDWPGVIDLTGRLSLVQLAALVERADLFIGADSGPAHLAAAVGTPVVTLFSGTNRAEQWRPWGDRAAVVRQGASCAPCHNTRCPLVDHPCMTQLLPDDVLSAVAGWLPNAPLGAPPRGPMPLSRTRLVPLRHEAVGERTLS